LSNRVEPEIPSITLDQDQVKTSRTIKSTQRNAINTKPAVAVPTVKTSNTNNFFTVFIYLVLIAASWFFYQENIKLQNLISHSEQRIISLENQLSATGEEMGESTIALKAKLEAMSSKTEKLWEEMDKLWASAWRRNQTEIKDLRSAKKRQDTLNNNQEAVNTKQAAQLANTTKNINTINDKVTSAEFNMTALADQISAASNIQDQIKQLTSQFTTLKEKTSGRDVQQMEIATNVNQLEMSVTLLIERLEKIERFQQSTPKSTQSLPIPTNN